jgi:hypothetical protein
MTQIIYNVVKAPVGWSLISDGVRIGGIFGTKEAALEAATVAASFSVRDGQGIQINVPEEPATAQGIVEAWPSKWNELLK